VPRALTALAATIVAASGGYVVALVARGRYLEDLCITRAPGGAPPEGVVVRGPVPDGLVGFRCEAAAAPRYSFDFTDAVPFLGTCAVAAVVVAVALLAWTWAVRGRPSSRG
jgi:hypothetical protein